MNPTSKTHPLKQLVTLLKFLNAFSTIRWGLAFRKLMFVLFLLSIVAVPVSWFKLSLTALLWALGFFFLMMAYQVVETFYDEYKRRRNAKPVAPEPQPEKRTHNIHHHLRKS